jgi:hypothetical protein
VKRYKLARKAVLNIVGVLKLLLGRTVWLAWELDLGKTPQGETALRHAVRCRGNHRCGGGAVAYLVRGIDGNRDAGG